MNFHLLADIIWVGIITAWGTWDAQRNNNGKPIFLHNHAMAWMARLIVGWLIIQFIYMYPGVNTTAEAWDWFWNLCRYCAWGWPLFDLGYNLVRKGVKWNHVGTTALTDKVFHDIYEPNPFLAQSIAKIFLIGVTTAIAWVF